MNDHEKAVISWTIDSLKKEIDDLQALLDANVKTVEIVEIQKYISGSGNETIKCFDENNVVVCYIRQSHKPFWKNVEDEIGYPYWDTLQSLDVDSIYGCSIKVQLVREKDFNLIWKVEHFEILGTDFES